MLLLFVKSMLYCIAYYTLVTSLWATGSAEVQSLSQKVNIPWCSIITLANVDRLSKFFHQLIRRKILDLYTTKIFTTPAICCYTTLWNLKIQKCSWFWDFSSILNKLLTCSWRHFEGLISHLTVVRQNCLKTADTDWLKFVRRRLESTDERCSVERCCIMAIFFTMISFAPTSFFLGYTSDNIRQNTGVWQTDGRTDGWTDIL